MSLAPSFFCFGKKEFFLLALYLTLSLVNMKEYIPEGRFWAEEGQYFFAHMLTRSWLEGVLLLYNGHLQLPTNIVALLAAQVPLLFAPLVSNLLAFVLQSIPVVLLVIFHRKLNLSALLLGLFIIVLVGMPQSDEVQSNAANLQFHFVFLAAVIILLSEIDSRLRYLLRGLLLLCGLSGIPANILAPVFIVKAVIERNREPVIQAGIISFTCIAQLYLLISNEDGLSKRVIEFVPVATVYATVCQQFLAPVLGYRFSLPIISELRATLQIFHVAVPLSIFLLFGLAWCYRKIFWTSSAQARYLGAGVVFLIGVSVATMAGEKVNIISNGLGNGRYFFAPNAILFLSLCQTVSLNRSKIALAVLLTAALSSLVFGMSHVLTGPSWYKVYHNTMEKNSSDYPIWGGEGWYLNVP